MAIANEISGIEDCVYSLTNKANIMKLSINDIVIQLFIPLSRSKLPNTKYFILDMLFHGTPFFVTV